MERFPTPSTSLSTTPSSTFGAPIVMPPFFFFERFLIVGMVEGFAPEGEGWPCMSTEVDGDHVVVSSLAVAFTTVASVELHRDEGRATRTCEFEASEEESIDVRGTCILHRGI